LTTTATPFASTVYADLPAQQRRRIERQIGGYVKALAQAIDAVLEPTLGRSGSGYVASDETIPLYGVGATPGEAMQDYRSVVVEYYEGLEADADMLGEEQRRQLAVLRRVFESVDRES